MDLQNFNQAYIACSIMEFAWHGIRAESCHLCSICVIFHAVVVETRRLALVKIEPQQAIMRSCVMAHRSYYFY